jgi:RNA polymerase sigma factor (sigma-70 family)
MSHACAVRSNGAETKVSEREGAGVGEARGRRLAERMRWREATDAELVAAVRSGSYEALREFYARFEPLLARFAARAGVRTERWEEDAHDVLSDVVLALIDVKSSVRARESVHDIHAYIQRAFRNRLLDAKRAEDRREQRDALAALSVDATQERVMLASCSEGSLRASSGEERDSAGPPRAIARMAAVLDSELSVDERRMLAWVSNAVPMRDIAAWLHIGYSAAKVRLSRTRSRLRVRALRHVNECTGSEREELIDFFRRSGGEMRMAMPTRPRDASAATLPPSAEPGRAHGDD